MSDWYAGVGGFVALLLVHVLVWRYLPHWRRYPILFALFLFVPSLLILFSVTSFCIALCLGLNYLAIFPAFQASSPTIHLLNRFWKSSQWEESVLRQSFTHDVVGERLQELQRGRFILESNGLLTLSLRGKVLANIFLSFRAILGLPAGDGG